MSRSGWRKGNSVSNHDETKKEPDSEQVTSSLNLGKVSLIGLPVVGNERLRNKFGYSRISSTLTLIWTVEVTDN